MEPEQSPQRKKGGRPRKHSPDAKRPTMSFRISSKLHERLIAASVANERSLSEEIEHRMEESFEVKETAQAVSDVARQAIEDAQDAYAIQAIHSTLEELQEDLGHPYALPVALYMGQGFTEAAEKIRAETPNEIWFDSPQRMKEAAEHMHRRVDSLFAGWSGVTYRTTLWGLFQRYRENIFRKKADGTYVRRAAEAKARQEAEEAKGPS